MTTALPTASAADTASDASLRDLLLRGDTLYRFAEHPLFQYNRPFVAKYSRHRIKHPTISLYLTLVLFYAITIGLPGLYISIAKFPASDHRYIRIFDRQEIGAVIVYALIFAPAVWIFYSQQPNQIGSVLQDLQHQGVIATKSTFSISDSMSATALGLYPMHPIKVNRLPLFSNRHVFRITLILFFIALSVWPPLTPFSWKADIRWHHYWFGENIIFFVWWVFITFFVVYPICWIVIRQLRFDEILVALFNNQTLRPLPHHEDGCNGMSRISKYTWRSLGVSMSIMCFVFMLATQPVLNHTGWHQSPEMIALIFAWLLVAFPIAVLPTIRATRCLRTVRTSAKKEARLVMSQAISQPHNPAAWVEALAHATLLESGFRTVPIGNIVLFSFLLGLAAPIMLNLCSSAIWTFFD